MILAPFKWIVAIFFNWSYALFHDPGWAVVGMSVLLSLLGNLMSGRFSLIGFLISTAVSIAVSLVIGFLLPMQKVGSAACRKACT